MKVANRPIDPRLKDLISRAKVISFDFYDTLVTRIVADPLDVFDVIEQRAGRPGFALDRQNAQSRAARQIVKVEGREITLRDIYDELSDPDGPRLSELELDIEANIVRLDPAAERLWHHALAAGKILVITSDMYLPGTAYWRMLENLQLRPHAIFVSADHGVTKRVTGQLFERVCAELGVQAEDILHIGDNLSADVEIPGKKGLLTWYWPRAHIGLRQKSLTRSVIASLSAQVDVRQNPSIAWRMGYQIAGPAAVGYLAWLRKNIAIDRVTKLLFIARDGFILDTLNRAGGTAALPGGYFLGSRTAFRVAAITDASFDAGVQTLLSGSRGKTLRHVFHRAGLGELLGELRGIDPDVLIDRRLEATLPDILRSMRPAMLALASRVKAGLAQTLRSFGIMPCDRVGLVDIGWRATTHISFEASLAGIANLDVIGYNMFFCGFEKHEKSRPVHAPRAMISDLTDRQQLVRWCYQNRIGVEILFSAPHGSIVGYRPKPDEEIEVVEDRPISPSMHDFVQAVNEGASQFRLDMDDAHHSMQIEFDDRTLIEPLLDWIRAPDVDSLKALNFISEFDGWNNPSAGPMGAIQSKHYWPAARTALRWHSLLHWSGVSRRPFSK